MTLPGTRTVALLLAFASPALLHAQNEPVIIQAEAGTWTAADPAVFTVVTEGDTQFVRVVGNFVTVNGVTQSPNTDTRVIAYTVSFPAVGTFDLYARIRVGPAQFDDDSFYYANLFGPRDPLDPEQWITVNNLASAGFTSGTVAGGGTEGSEVWKWVKLSSNNYTGDTGVPFVVPAGQLVQTFQIGSRENGLDFDRFAFGTGGVDYTVAALDSGQPGTPPQIGPPSATGKPKFLGNIYSTSQLPGFTAYWNQVAPENAGKWGSVEGTRDVMNWTQLDAAYALAKNNGFPFRFHVLVWGNQQPAWIESLPPAEQLEEIEEWFAAVAARYPDIDHLEVVNEPLHDPPNQPGSGGGNYIGALGGAGTTGWDWVVNAFRLAREHFPDTKLVLNDYNIVGSTTNTRRYLEIIALLQAENLIDVIGVQAHAFSTRGSAAAMAANLDLLAATGLPIQATEMDIDGPTDAQQLEDYQRIFPTFWQHPAVMGVTLWGYRPGLWRNEQGAYIILADGTERPALTWLRTYVAASDPPLRPMFTAHPVDAARQATGSATFTVAVSGNPAPTLRWQRSTDAGILWTDLADDGTFSGTGSAGLTVAAVDATMDGHLFRAVATNSTATPVPGRTARLDVTRIAGAVALSDLTRTHTGSPLAPTSTTTPGGLGVVFTFDGVATTPTNAGTYAVVATIDDASYEGSASATFYILPRLTPGQPGTVEATAGGGSTLSIAVAGAAAPSHQWQVQRGGSGAWIDLAGATSGTLVIPSAQHFHAGNYRVVVNANGASATSDPVALNVAAPAASDARLMNLSTRALCLTGDDVIIPGFVIEGTGTKRLLIRAAGPELQPMGVPDPLPNPRMLLKRKVGEEYVDYASNDNWGDSINAGAIADAAAALSAFALDPGSLSAALLLDLPVGQYTVVASDAGTSTGVGIVELYDLEQASSGTRLVNISNRGYVGVGDHIMIPGFIVSEEGSRTFLIRAIGPTLAGFDVSGTMADPKLRVFRGANPILANDNWGESGDAALTAATSARVWAFALDEGSADAAFVVTLPPGAYTVQASGVGGIEGVVLVEIYLVP